MIELELFYKTVEAEIRRKYVKYLKKRKCLPESIVEAGSASTVAPAAETVASDRADDLEGLASDNLKYVKRFNKGIETALNVLAREFARFNSRFPDECSRGRRL